MDRSTFPIALVILATSVTVTLADAAPYDFLGAFCTGTMCDNGMECLNTHGGICDPESTTRANSQCTCGGAGGDADPYFSGFTGQQFYFPAEAGNIYNLLSEADHLVNAEFVDTELPSESDLVGLVSGAKNSSFIGAVGLQHKKTKVVVSCNHASTLSMSVDGEALDLNAVNLDFAAELEMDDGITIFFEKDKALGQQMVAIHTDLVVLTIYVNPVHIDNMGNEVRGHLDVLMGLKRTILTAPAAHGILGQTVNPMVTSQIRDKFPGAGVAADYMVSSLFASDYPYNMFGVATSSPSPSPVLVAGTRQQARPASVAMSRRLLKTHNEEAAPLQIATSSRRSQSSASR